jgi:hypothetical protein
MGIIGKVFSYAAPVTPIVRVVKVGVSAYQGTRALDGYTHGRISGAAAKGIYQTFGPAPSRLINFVNTLPKPIRNMR